MAVLGQGSIVIVTGPPAAGKSTLARRLAAEADGPLGVHMHADDFYAYIVKGFIEPWKPASHAQNTVICEALTAAAARYAQGGYLVALDGVVGPWFLDSWRAAAAEVPVHYAVLMPDARTNVARFAGRRDHPLQDAAVVTQMWQAFDAHREGFERHMLDTSGQGVDASLAALRAGVAEGRFRL